MYLSELIDVYSDWIDVCERINVKDEDESEEEDWDWLEGYVEEWTGCCCLFVVMIMNDEWVRK